MLKVPKSFLEIITAPHQTKFWASVWSGVRLLDPHVRIVEGSVTADSKQDIRYTADVTLDFDFETRLDLRTTALNVYSGRVALYCSVYGAKDESTAFTHPQEVVVPLGHYRVTDMQQQDLGLVKLDLEGYEGYVIDDIFTAPRTIDDIMRNPELGKRDERVIPAIVRLIRESFADDPHSASPGSIAYDRYLRGNPYRAWHGMDVIVQITNRALLETTLADIAPVERDRWGLIKWFASTYNLDVYCAADGRFRIRESPSRRSAFNQFPADWSVMNGVHGMLTTISHSVTRDNVHNAVIAYKESVSSADGTSTGPIQAQFYENDPHSPIYWKGPYGRKPMLITGDYANHSEAAMDALVKLNDAYGYNSEMSFGLVPNPALEPNDLVYVQYPDGRMEKHIIESLTIPLGHSGTMSAKTRAKSELRYVVWQDPAPPANRLVSDVLTSPHPGSTMIGGQGMPVYRWRSQHVQWMKTRSMSNLTETRDNP